MRASFLVLALAAALVMPVGAAWAQSTGDAILVTPDNFKRAETDTYFAGFASQGAFGKFDHNRDLPLENAGVRPNRDTLYSLAVFDLDAGPVTITLPDAGDRFMSLLIIDEDHYALEVDYGPGTHTFAKDEVGTRYFFAAVRTLVDPNDPADMDQARALQDAIKVEQPGGPRQARTAELGQSQPGQGAGRAPGAQRDTA